MLVTRLCLAVGTILAVTDMVQSYNWKPQKVDGPVLEYVKSDRPKMTSNIVGDVSRLFANILKYDLYLMVQSHLPYIGLKSLSYVIKTVPR